MYILKSNLINIIDSLNLAVKFKLTDGPIEVGDIVAYMDKESRKEGKRLLTVDTVVVGVWEEIWDETFKKFRNRVVCTDQEKTTCYNEKWLKKVELIQESND